MCEPTSIAIASFALASASTVASYQGQMTAAKQQNAAFQENARRANAEVVRGYDVIGERSMQERASAARQIEDNRRDAQRARATMTAAAGESNVSGLSVEALLRDFYGRETDFNDRTFENLDNTERQLRREMQGVRASGEDRIASVRPANAPSFLDAGLRIAGAGVDSAARYRMMTNRRET